MRRLVSYMFMSLDGFIADADGELDWVPIDDELMGFANEYFRSVDGIVFGRNTYRGFVEYWDHLLLISGPDLRSSLTRAGLVDLHRILVVPAVLGLGVPMFRDLDGLLRLRLVGTRKFDGGVVMLDYEPG